MSLSVDDLKPKSFKVNVKGVELESKPVRLSHALAIAKIGNVFQDTKAATKEEIKQAEKDMDEVVGELIPELAGVELDIGATMQLIEQLMEQVEPADNKELKKKGVEFNSDPKA